VSATSSSDPKAELARGQEQALREQFEDFPSSRVLTWVGALPAWTADLGSQLGLTGSEPVAGLVSRLEAEELIETREILDADGLSAESFWLRPAVRQGLGRYLQETPVGQERIDQDLDDLADAVEALELTSATPGSIGSAEWLKIVRIYRKDPSGQRLMADVDELVSAGKRADASALVAAARGLGELASSTLLDAARRAQWRIDRIFRMEQDTQRLRHYRPRPRIETSIYDLINTAFDDPRGTTSRDVMADPARRPWALHLLGDGGMGKTMLIRYLASGRFAEAHKLPSFLVARADFDHLDPQYPEQRPAELLLALAADLVSFADTRELYRLYRLFHDAANMLHERQPGRLFDQGTEQELREAVRLFAEFLNSLGPPVLLVLDTCEELAKSYLPNAPAPAIDETFRLLELVQEKAPHVRVLFAGRRRLVPAPEGGGSSGPLLQPRWYVRVLTVGGFTGAEADAYIVDRETTRRAESPGSAPLRRDLREAVLACSRAAERPGSGVEYSPFELAAYYDWASSDPDIDASQFQSAQGDPYVEWRIIGRLGDNQVRAALGVAAEFGRFDLTLLAPALGRAGKDARAAFSGLATQEWVNVLSLGEDGGPAVIEIDEHLLDRIRAVTSRSPEWFPLDRGRLGADARQVIESKPLRELPAETVEAAIRLLPPESAATLWQDIEDRCCAEGAWGWATQITARVAARERERVDRQGSGSPTILAAILATQAAARLHTGPDSDPTPLWHEVERRASRHPDDELRVVLRLRARLGLLATGDLTDTTVIAEALLPAGTLASAIRTGTIASLVRVGDIGRARDFLLGAIVAAVHGYMARDHELPGSVAIRLLDGLAAAAGISSAGAAVLQAKAIHQIWAGSLDDAASTADQAIEVADQAATRPDRSWADWAAPRRLADQCRLMRMIIAWRRGEAADSVPWQSWRADAVRRLDDIDSERLVAATIRFELGHRLIAPEELEHVERLERYVPRRRPSEWVHRQVDPLVIELAEAWRVHGNPERSYSLMSERIDAAVAAGTDPDTIETCELAQLQLCRRERTTAFSAVQRLSSKGSARTRAEAWLVRTLVDGEQPRSVDEAGGWSAWWRCQDTASLASLETTPAAPPSAGVTDLAEFAEFFPGPAAAVPGEAGSDRPSHDFDPENEFRLGRQLTLPPGALGRLAMSVAEVAALRFPERAIPHLLYAGLQLDSAGDGHGAVRARLLASLAIARCQDRQEVAAAWPSRDALLAAEGQAAEGWQQRVDVITAYMAQRPAPAGLPPSPEMRLPAPDSHRLLSEGRDILARWGPTTEVVTVGGGGAVAAGIGLATLGAADAGTTAAVVALLILVRVLALWLPYRFVKVRAIEVSQPEEGVVGAVAVPSRGVRDLRGLGLATIGGALAGRWPLKAMFVPWRGPWAQYLPTSDPPPAFDLHGLRLPGRGGDRRLVMLEIRADDADSLPSPWEQWLGSAVSLEQAPALLWYRRVRGHAWAPRRPEWRNADAQYFGTSSHHQTENAYQLRVSGQESAEKVPSLRLLHMVGTPVPTKAGWRFRVAYTGASSTPSRGVEAGERLLSFDGFPLKRTALAVLQADPVDGPPQTLARVRSGFMGCAQDLLDGGVNAVLVVPPLPDDVARDVAETVSKMVAARGRRPSPTTVLRVQAHVKRLVAEALSPEGRGNGPVLDVLLFLRAAGSGAQDPTTERST
jgi:hypothetical protein